MNKKEMFYRKSWHIFYSSKGFGLKLTKEHIGWESLEYIFDFFTHKISKFIPMLPFPIIQIHWKDCYCFICHYDTKDRKTTRLKFHNPYTYWGWNLESFLCATVENWIIDKSLSYEEEILRIDILDDDLLQQLMRDKRSRKFIDEMKKFDREDNK